MAYFANGSEGEILEDQCAECRLAPLGCPVYRVQMHFNYEQVAAGQEKLRKALNMLISERGECLVRKALEG